MQGEITYDAATTEDIAPIYQLCRKLILDYEDLQRIDLDRVLQWIEKKIQRAIAEYTVVCVDGRKAGYYHFFQNEDGLFELDDLYIFPAFQNRGIGSGVIRKCCAEVDGPVMLYVFIKNHRAVSLYERLGFRVTETLGGSRYIMKRDKVSANRELRKKIILEHMGKCVHVVVDRPIGYHHGDLVYPVNYGYIPGVTGGDGEEQDAYILGVTEPLETFDGQVVGAIRRKNDCEDKLVVAPMGQVYHQGQIAEAVHFQEQYFSTSVDSLLRKSCGVIPFRQNGNEREYLILLQTNHCWSFPKGHMEMGETEEQTALRELREETGLSAQLIPGQRAVSEYDVSHYARKQVVLFLGAVEGNVTAQAEEVVQHRWVKAEALKDYLHPDTYAACAGLLK